jgi:hypothetical protein
MSLSSYESTVPVMIAAKQHVELPRSRSRICRRYLFVNQLRSVFGQLPFRKSIDYSQLLRSKRFQLKVGAYYWNRTVQQEEKNPICR